jgi:hypothetical protein
MRKLRTLFITSLSYALLSKLNASTQGLKNSSVNSITSILLAGQKKQNSYSLFIHLYTFFMPY